VKFPLPRPLLVDVVGVGGVSVGVGVAPVEGFCVRSAEGLITFKSPGCVVLESPFPLIGLEDEEGPC